MHHLRRTRKDCPGRLSWKAERRGAKHSRLETWILRQSSCHWRGTVSKKSVYNSVIIHKSFWKWYIWHYIKMSQNHSITVLCTHILLLLALKMKRHYRVSEFCRVFETDRSGDRDSLLTTGILSSLSHPCKVQKYLDIRKISNTLIDFSCFYYWKK